MTPEERARKIVVEFISATDTRYEAAVKFVAAQIAEAEREAVIALCEGEDCFVARKEQEAFAEGFAAAQAKAVGIAKAYPETAGLTEGAWATPKVCGTIAARGDETVSFSDEELKRLKERAMKGNPKMILHWHDVDDLIARLEAAEDLIMNHTVTPIGYDNKYKAWRRRCGK